MTTCAHGKPIEVPCSSCGDTRLCAHGRPLNMPCPRCEEAWAKDPMKYHPYPFDSREEKIVRALEDASELFGKLSKVFLDLAELKRQRSWDKFREEAGDRQNDELEALKKLINKVVVITDPKEGKFEIHPEHAEPLLRLLQRYKEEGEAGDA